MATRDDQRRRRELENNPGLHPELRWWVAQVNRYCKAGPHPGLQTTSTTSTTSSTTTTSTTTTAP